MGNVNTLTTGSGNDNVTATTAFGAGDTVDLGAGTDVLSLTAGANTLSALNAETVQTSASASDTLNLENGFGGGGTTFADLGGGSDTLNLANANNTIFATGFEVINGGTGDDTLTINSSEASSLGAVTWTGGAHTTGDTLIFNGGATLLDTNLAGVTGWESWTLATAAIYDFTLANANVASAQTLLIEAGGTTSTVIDAVLETDGSVSIIGGSGADVITGKGDNVTVDGGAGNDILQGGGAGETLFGGLGDDTVGGGLGNDFVFGGDGNDDLEGNGGADTIDGGSGNDIINGGAAGDFIIGGAGADTIDVSSGADIIAYNDSTEGGDTIIGFVSGTDTLRFDANFFSGDLAGVLNPSNFIKDTTGNIPTFQDADDFFIFNTDTNTLSYDADGNGAGAEVTIAVFDNNDLVAADITFTSGIA